MRLIYQFTLVLFLIATISIYLQSPSTVHAGNRTVVQSGNWNDPATWGGTLPGDSDNITVPSALTLTVPDGVTISRYGTTSVNGTLDIYGQLRITQNQILDNEGSIRTFNNTGFRIYNMGWVLNSGTIANGGIIRNAETGLLSNTANGTLVNKGTLDNYGSITNNNVLTNEYLMRNLSSITNNATLTNYGSLINYCGGVISGNPVTGEPVEVVPVAGVPTLDSPAHRTHTTDTTPTLTWGSVSGAESYRLMVYLEDRSFEYKKRVFDPTYTLKADEALAVNKYLWRVRTQDANCQTWSAWSGRNTLFVD